MFTNIYQRGNYLYTRGVEGGQRFNRKVEFQPTLWVSGKATTQSPWRTLDGSKVDPIQPGSIYDCKQFLEKYKDVHGFDVYDAPSPTYQYIAENYPGDIVFDPSDVSVFTVDIETETEYGFPDPKLAQEVIQLITVKDRRHKNLVTWGLRPFNNQRSDVEYRHLSSEQALLRDFIGWWQHNCPDVVTGWNSSLFDLTYLYNRMCRVLDENIAKKLSPWGQVTQRDVDLGGRFAVKTYIAGVASLDYLDLYKKFTYSAQESYKLDYIAYVELGERKLENPGSTFKEFYTDHWETFCLYNIRDVELVDKLDDKMKLMDLAMTIAYAAKVNYEDVFSPVKTWDIIIYNYLNDHQIVVPRRRENMKAQAYEGAYVKDPLIGKHDWCCSFDLNSLYPMLMVQYNLSPDTITDIKLDVTVDGMLSKSIDLTPAVDMGYAVAATGWCFRKDKQGLMPTLAQHYYNQRVVSKKQMIKEKQDLEKIKAEMERRGLV